MNTAISNEARADSSHLTNQTTVKIQKKCFFSCKCNNTHKQPQSNDVMYNYCVQKNRFTSLWCVRCSARSRGDRDIRCKSFQINLDIDNIRIYPPPVSVCVCVTQTFPTVFGSVISSDLHVAHVYHLSHLNWIPRSFFLINIGTSCMYSPHKHYPNRWQCIVTKTTITATKDTNMNTRKKGSNKQIQRAENEHALFALMQTHTLCYEDRYVTSTVMCFHIYLYISIITCACHVNALQVVIVRGVCEWVLAFFPLFGFNIFSSSSVMLLIFITAAWHTSQVH